MIIKNNKKTIIFSLYFAERNDNDTKMYRFLLPKILLKTNDLFKTEKMFRKQLQNYYDARFNVKRIDVKDNSVLNFNFVFVHPDEVDEKTLFNDVFEFFYKTIFNRELFSEEIFNIEKRNAIELFESFKDYIPSYGRERFSNVFYNDDLNYEEKLKQIENITLVDLYLYYKKMIETNIIDYFISGNVTDEMINTFYKKFENISKELNLTPNYVEEREHQLVVDKLVTRQTILYLGYTIKPFTNSYNYEPEILANYIIGGFSESILFQVIREEMGLCYNISSTIDVNKASFIIHSGVNYSSKDKAISAITNLIDELKIKGITDFQLEVAKKQYLNAIKELKDNQIEVASFNYLGQKLNRTSNFEEKYKLISDVKKEDVMKVINNLELNTTYVLEGNIEENK